eukprot:TRINITY_DN2785_c0_g1_i1.p1 TRINITY_DN2785_c0_g1~~TRINITY_DN2785_c0_g1_i1.p1  ORF type:complete len:363 (-),score=118.97 TRINITY_DN2785_c0_g1_i1:340-1428(-)
MKMVVPTSATSSSTTTLTKSSSTLRSASNELTSTFHALRIRLSNQNKLFDAVDQTNATNTSGSTTTSGGSNGNAPPTQDTTTSASSSSSPGAPSSASVPSSSQSNNNATVAQDDKGILGFVKPLSSIFPQRRKSSSSFLNKSYQVTVITTQAAELVEKIRKAYYTLEEVKTSYVNPYRHFSNYTTPMTEKEREEFDLQIRGLILEYSNMIESIKQQIEKDFTLSPQVLPTYDFTAPLNPSDALGLHLRGIVSVLYDRLEILTKLFADLRAVRLKLTTSHKEEPIKKEKPAPKAQSKPYAPPTIPPLGTLKDETLKGLSEDEIKELEQENKMLLRDFDKVFDQARAIEQQASSYHTRTISVTN